MKPVTLMNMVSNLLYERRFGPYFVEPVVAGLDTVTQEPYVASMDLIGCPMEPGDFVVSGTCNEQMYGMCETLWEPDLVSDGFLENETSRFRVFRFCCKLADSGLVGCLL